MEFKETTVSVTAEDIAQGRRGDPFGCPLALALGRAGCEGAAVGLMTYGVGVRWERRLPEEALDFRRNFDSRNPVEPFTFKAELPAPAAEGQGQGERERKA